MKSVRRTDLGFLLYLLSWHAVSEPLVNLLIDFFENVHVQVVDQYLAFILVHIFVCLRAVLLDNADNLSQLVLAQLLQLLAESIFVRKCQSLGLFLFWLFCGRKILIEIQFTCGRCRQGRKIVFNELLEILFQLICDFVYPGSFCVVQLAVIPDHLNIVQTLFDGVVFVLRQFLFGCTQIHRVLDDLRVICQSECYVIHGLPELGRVLMVN